MRHQKNWKSFSRVVAAMKQCGACLVIRNYEELSDERYYMEGHDDIDFLCESAQMIREVRKILDVRKNVPWGAWTHAFVKIAGKDVKLGFRYVGDGYYCTAWEQEMLRTRITHERGFDVMSQENYFYSLLYHVVLQRWKVSEDYCCRLKTMGAKLGITLDTDESYLRILLQFLEQHHYLVTYPEDVANRIIIAHFSEVPQEMRVGYGMWKIRRFLYAPRILYGRIMWVIYRIFQLKEFVKRRYKSWVKN